MQPLGRQQSEHLLPRHRCQARPVAAEPRRTHLSERCERGMDVTTASKQRLRSHVDVVALRLDRCQSLLRLGTPFLLSGRGGSQVSDATSARRALQQRARRCRGSGRGGAGATEAAGAADLGLDLHEAQLRATAATGRRRARLALAILLHAPHIWRGARWLQKTRWHGHQHTLRLRWLWLVPACRTPQHRRLWPRLMAAPHPPIGPWAAQLLVPSAQRSQEPGEPQEAGQDGALWHHRDGTRTKMA